MMRVVAISSLLLAAHAPIQCGSGPDPGLRQEDTAGDALWDLARDFRAKGNDASAKDTLRYLVAHYPSNRHAPEAKAELGEAPEPAASVPK